LRTGGQLLEMRISLAEKNMEREKGQRAPITAYAWSDHADPTILTLSGAQGLQAGLVAQSELARLHHKRQTAEWKKMTARCVGEL